MCTSLADLAPGLSDPATALTLANGASALLWVGCGALVVGNCIIGMAEGWMLAKAFAVQRKRAALLMTAANLASAIAGSLLLPLVAEQVDGHVFTEARLFRAGQTLAVVAAIAFLLTVAIELPLVLLVTRGTARSGAARFAAGIWVQAVSYAALAAIFFAVSPMTLLTKCTPVRDAAPLAGGAQGWVYFIDSGHTGVRRIRLDGTREESVIPLPTAATTRDARAGIWLRDDPDGSASLLVTARLGETTLLSGLRGVVGYPGNEDYLFVPAQYWAVDFRPKEQRANTFKAGFYHPQGLRIESAPGDPQWRSEDFVSFSTPALSWEAKFPTVLPNGSVVFEFGEQIVIVDGSRRIGLLARGCCPTVLMDESGEPR